MCHLFIGPEGRGYNTKISPFSPLVFSFYLPGPETQLHPVTDERSQIIKIASMHSHFEELDYQNSLHTFTPQGAGLSK